jgi:hypothetical protein
MKSLNEQTIKRLQKLAGINEIKVQLPINQFPPSLQKFLDEELLNPFETKMKDVINILVGWIEGASDDGGLGYFKSEGNFDDYRDDYGDFDPETEKFIKAVKKLPKSMYLGNMPRLPFKKDITRAYNTKIIFNDPDPESFITYIVADSNDGEYLEGYFNISGEFIKFD